MWVRMMWVRIFWEVVGVARPMGRGWGYWGVSGRGARDVCDGPARQWSRRNDEVDVSGHRHYICQRSAPYVGSRGLSGKGRRLVARALHRALYRRCGNLRIAELRDRPTTELRDYRSSKTAGCRNIGVQDWAICLSSTPAVGPGRGGMRGGTGHLRCPPGAEEHHHHVVCGGRLATLLHPSPAMTPPPRETPAPDGNRRGSGVPLILPTPRLGGLDEGGEIR